MKLPDAGSHTDEELLAELAETALSAGIRASHPGNKAFALAAAADTYDRLAALSEPKVDDR